MTNATSAHAQLRPAYTATARVLHWLTATIILIMIPLGFVAANDWGIPQQTHERLYNLHKSLGALVLPLALVRLIYRLTHPPLPLPPDIVPLQRIAAHATHWTLYALLIVQPLVGWIGTSAYPAPLPVFGLFELPKIWPEDRAFSEQLFVLHRWLGIALAVVVAMHIGAALHHHLVRKDRVLMRMLTGS
jgi:cytochrome b561